MSSTLPPGLINFLNNPDSYPHNPERVKHIQTHISHVFIASPFVYKFKKPVNFGFLDFSTLEKRKFYCEQEVELNRRLCDGLYLGVIPIYKENENWSFESIVNDKPAEYAVQMKELSNDFFLIRNVNQGSLEEKDLDRVVNKLATFYNSQNPGKEILKWGLPEKIKVNTDENFNQTKPFIGRTINKNPYNTIRLFTNRFLHDGEHLFQKRIEEKRIVDGHGDLHLEHIYMKGDNVCIYDCIEFNERFRYLDVASDIGFLAMDLDFNEHRNESRYFVKAMSEKLQDTGLTNMIDFYKCYRSYVRGKVKTLESAEEEVSKSDRKKASDIAKRYFKQSLSYALFGSKPTVLIFMGRVGSGKSTLARQLEDVLGFRYAASDITRKRLADLPLSERTPASKRTQIYSDDMTNRIYTNLSETAKKELNKGNNVLLDATFSKPEYRNEIISQVKDLQSDYYFVETIAPAQVRKKRLDNRKYDSSVISDARREDFDMLDNRYSPPSEIEPPHLIRIDTDNSKEQSVEQLFHKLVDIQLTKFTKTGS